jgi:hypothetical protein
MIRNHNWYNLNSTRHYPLDDNATGETDSGTQLPNDILLDCHIRYPESVGRYLHISSATVTENLVTFTFLASNTTSFETPAALATDTFVPVAAITLTKPIDYYVHHAISPMYPGVGGWVVFGPGVEESFEGKFTTAEQAILAPKASRDYRALPISSIRKQDTSTALTGLVTIESSQTVEVIKATRTILGLERDVLVLRLSDLFDRNLLKLMRGACGGRPESNSCDPPGIGFLNDVMPDCDGNITINFVGHGHATPYEDDVGGILVNTGVGLSEACPVDLLPGSDGTLPNEYEDPCSSSSLAATDEPATFIWINETLTEEASEECLSTLPHCESFDSGLPDDFAVKSGSFTFVTDDSPGEPCGLTQEGSSTPLSKSYQTDAVGECNVALWDSCSYLDVRDKKCETAVKIMSPQGNGSIVINWHQHPMTGNPHFLALAVDLHAGQLQLKRFAGHTFSPSPLQYVAVPGMQHGDWLKLSVAVRPSEADPAAKSTVECSVVGLNDPDVAGTFTVDVDTISDATSDGKYGLCANFCLSRFSYFNLEQTS